MQSASDTSVSERAAPLSQSHTRTHFLMAPIEDRNGDEWSPSHQSNQKCIFHISVIELCTSCKLMRSSPLQLWQESTNNYLPIFPYVAINLNHWQATAAPPRHRFSYFLSCSPPSPSLFPRVPLPASRSRCLSAFWLRLRGIDSRLMWERPGGRLGADMGEAGNQGPTAVMRLRGFQVTVTWDFTCWHSSSTGGVRDVPKGHLVPGGKWGGRAGANVVCLVPNRRMMRNIARVWFWMTDSSHAMYSGKWNVQLFSTLV